MAAEQRQLLAGIAALDAQRALLGDAVVDASIAALRSKLVDLTTTPVAEPAQTLRQVSILFLDVVGSTTLSQHLDPEDIHAVMDGALARCTTVVLAHHGKVLQYAGDSLLATFGAEEVREDDAERSVRCGLALLAEGRALAAEVQAAQGHAGFDVRVGIHTGGVLLGGGVDADGTIRGIAVNIAARMEQTAPAGTLRISHDTYAQVRGIFDVEPQDPIVVKGVDTPIQSYLVRRAKPRAFRIATRGIEGMATRMIGRDAELEHLQRAFRRLFVERKLAAVTVVADPGLGKSRLLYEFEAWAEMQPEPFYIFRGRANPHTQGQPFGLLRDILVWRFQIQDDDSLEAARAKLEGGIVPLFQVDDGLDLAEGHAHLLGHLIGIDYLDSRHVKGILSDPKQIRNRAFHAAAQLFRRVSAQDGDPVILQLEDLHWADSESLDFLNYLAEINRDVALLILSTTRPTLFERRSDWKSVEGVHRRIDIAPLDKTGSRSLANELLKKLPEIPAVLRELLTGGAEGNPFYMEELVKMLIDQGAIETGTERWMLNAQRLLATQVPPTVTGVLQARLDGLPEAERLTLQEASVIGQVFWDRALEALDAQAQTTLPALVRRELALPRSDAEAGIQFEGLREYSFKHAMLHQVTYATVLKRARRELHGKLARWFSQQGGLRANDFLGLTAAHFEQAGEEASAAEYHARAAEHAASRLAHERVLEHVQRALGQLALQRRPTGSPGTPVTGEGVGALSPTRVQAALRWRLCVAREATLDAQGQRDAQRAELDAMDQLADQLNDDHLRAGAARLRASLGMRTADWAVQEASARRGARLAEAAGDSDLRLRCLRLLAIAQVDQGDWRSGQALAQRVLDEARRLALRDVESSCLNTLARIAGDMQGDAVVALEFDQQQLAIDREIGNRSGEACGLVNVGATWMALGALTRARASLDEALKMARANGERMFECATLSNLSQLALLQGEDVRASTLARAAQQIAVAVEANDWEAQSLLRLGDAEYALGRLGPARQAYEQAHVLATKIDHPWQHDASASLARLELALGDAPAARQHIEPQLSHREGGGSFDGSYDPRLVELSCYRVLAALGDPRANGWLESAQSTLQATAQSISDAALRQGFLTNIPHHREIVAAWATWQQSRGEASGAG